MLTLLKNSTVPTEENYSQVFSILFTFSRIVIISWLSIKSFSHSVKSFATESSKSDGVVDLDT